MSLWWKLLGLNVALYPTALGVHVVWAMPFGFLVMLAIFNRYDIAVEEAARDLGASAMQTFTRVTLPIIWGGVFGAALFGFTLSWNEFERTLLISPTPDAPARDLRRADLGDAAAGPVCARRDHDVRHDRAGVPDADHRRADRAPDQPDPGRRTRAGRDEVEIATTTAAPQPA